MSAATLPRRAMPPRLLVTCSPFPTHLMPLVSLCWAWRAAGGEILVAGQPDLAPVAAAAGLPFAPIGEHYDELARRGDRLVPPTVRGASPAPPPWDKLGVAWRERLTTVLDPVTALGRRWGADLILADPLEFAGLAVAARLGVPVVQHLWGADAWSIQVQQPARVQLSPLCRDLGLPGLPPADLVLDPRPPSLRAEPWGVPIRSVPFNGVGRVPDWVATRRRPRRVCVTLGTRHVALNGTALLRGTALAAAHAGAEVVLPLAAGDRDELGELPDAVRVVDPCPLNLFLDSCDVLVHHGASGTGMSGLVAGVPQLVLPWASFDTFHADAVADAGAGLSIYADEFGPDVVTDAVRRLLDEQHFGSRASDLAAEVAAMPSPSVVAESLLDLVRR